MRVCLISLDNEDDILMIRKTWLKMPLNTFAQSIHLIEIKRTKSACLWVLMVTYSAVVNS